MKEPLDFLRKYRIHKESRSFSPAGAACVRAGCEAVRGKLDLCAHAVHTRTADALRAADKVPGHHGPGQNLHSAGKR